jgi:hypothetical protein
VNLINGTFLTFEGEPVPGRMPTRVITLGENPMTPDQANAVVQMYQLFCAANAVSPALFSVVNRTLEDGTSVRMESRDGDDRVFVTPASTGGPRPLELAGYVILPRDAANTSGWDKGAKPDSARAYLPAKHAKALGTIPPKAQLHVKLNAGAVDWRGAHGVTLTYDHAGNNRYSTDMWGVVFTNTNNDSAANNVYYRGTKITTPAGVSAAAIFEGFLIIISANTVKACPSPIGRINAALARGQFIAEIAPTWSTISITGTVASARRASAWHFKPDGSVAAAAFVDSSFGVDTWTLRRMRTAALTMMKRYLTLAVVDGSLTCTVSDTAYACHEVGVTGGAGLADLSIPTGTLSFSGQRLWGIDWADDGTELVISFRRSGSGSRVAGGFGVSGSLAWDQHWAVFINENELFRVSSVIPEQNTGHAAFKDDLDVDHPAEEAAQVGDGVVSHEYVAIHALDARSGAALLERLTIAYTAAVTYSSFVPTNAYTIASNIEVVFDSAVISTHAESLTDFLPTCRIDVFNSDPRFGAALLIDNGALIDFSRINIPAYPQCGSALNENIYEQLFADSSMTSRAGHSFFSSYPNQVSDTLGKLMFVYTEQITVFTFGYRFASYSGDPWIGFPVTLSDSVIVTGATSLGPYTSVTYFIAKAGLAFPAANPLHFIATARDLFANQYEDIMKKLQQRNHSLTQSGIAPAYFASIMTRPDTMTGWTETDLLTPIAAKVTADGDAPDSASFHIDPVRIL